MIEKQGLLHIGDVILEVNGTPVHTPEDLQSEIAKTKDHVTLKVGNSNYAPETHSSLVNGSPNGVPKRLTVINQINENLLFIFLKIKLYL